MPDRSVIFDRTEDQHAPGVSRERMDLRSGPRRGARRRNARAGHRLNGYLRTPERGVWLSWVQRHRNRRVAAGHYGCREETAGNATTKTVGENVSQHSAQVPHFLLHTGLHNVDVHRDNLLPWLVPPCQTLVLLRHPKPATPRQAGCRCPCAANQR